jgi:hypothetical protein
MSFPLVRDLAAAGVPVAVACRVLGFSRQAFYAWATRPVSQRDWDDAHLINAAYDIHADDPAFSDTGLSPTNSPMPASVLGVIGWPGCARLSGSGLRSPRRRG